jgi:hypothetical protein
MIPDHRTVIVTWSFGRITNIGMIQGSRSSRCGRKGWCAVWRCMAVAISLRKEKGQDWWYSGEPANGGWWEVSSEPTLRRQFCVDTYVNDRKRYYRRIDANHWWITMSIYLPFVMGLAYAQYSTQKLPVRCLMSPETCCRLVWGDFNENSARVSEQKMFSKWFRIFLR